jgi:hypothetical protein
MQVKEILEEALYLSIKDRMFNAIPADPVEKAAILTPFIKDINRVLDTIGKKNPAFSSVAIDSTSLTLDAGLQVYYIDLRPNPFLILFNVGFMQGGGQSYSLKRLSINDFLKEASLRTNSNTFPSIYVDNLLDNKIYVYPTPTSGSLSVTGKQKICKDDGDPFSSIDDTFPTFLTDSFFSYLELAVAQRICMRYKAHFTEEKEMLTARHELENASNISYQSISNSTDFPILRDLRTFS